MNFRSRGHFRGSGESLPVARALPEDWGVTSGCEVTSGGLGTGSFLTSGCEVSSGSLGSHFRVTSGVWEVVKRCCFLIGSRQGHVTV